MIKHLPQRPRHPRPPRLLPVNRVHALITKQPYRPGIVHPFGEGLAGVGWVEGEEGEDVGEDEEEAGEGDLDERGGKWESLS